MATSNQPSGRRYPVILDFYVQYIGMEEEFEKEEYVFNDLQYESLVSDARRNNKIVRERQPTFIAEEIAKEEKEAKELAELNKRKLNADLSLVEKTLKSYPFTKWSARIALLISIFLLVIEILKLFKRGS